MTLADWLEDAARDADARGLPELAPMLAALARSTALLREAPWNPDPGGMHVDDRPDSHEQ